MDEEIISLNTENQVEIQSVDETKDSWRAETQMSELQKMMEDSANKVYVPYCVIERRNITKKTNLTPEQIKEIRLRHNSQLMSPNDAIIWENADSEERKAIYNSLDDQVRQQWNAFNLAYELNGEVSLQEIFSRLQQFTPE